MIHLQLWEQNKNIEEIFKIEAQNIIDKKTLLKDSTPLDEELLFEAEVKNLVTRWKANPEMMEFLTNKAKEKGMPLEQVIIDDARWVLREEAKKKNK